MLRTEDKKRLSQSSTLEQIRFTIVPVAFLITDKLPERSSLQEGLILAHSLGGCCPSQQGRKAWKSPLLQEHQAGMLHVWEAQEADSRACWCSFYSAQYPSSWDGASNIWRCTALVPARGRQRRELSWVLIPGCLTESAESNFNEKTCLQKVRLRGLRGDAHA